MSNRVHTFGVVLALAATGAAQAVHAQTPSTPSVADASGAVYTANNATSTNEVVAYHRAADGALTYLGTYETGGRGSGGAVDPLQSQNSLVVSDDHRFLFVANSGTSDITVFSIGPDGGLRRIARTPSRGGFPVSIAVHGNLLYVLNAGGAGSVSGFHILANGRLFAIPGSTHLLSATSAGGSSIDISLDGAFLAAAERLTNRIDIFPLDANGAAAAPAINNSNGKVPFALTFTPQDALLVAEVAGNPAGGSAISSYAVQNNGTLSTISASVPTGYNAGCWLIATANGELAFDANAGSSEISVDTIGNDGTLSTVGAASTGAGSIPLDLALSANNRYLYALTTGTGTITGFEVGPSGGLSPVGAFESLPAASGQNGLAAF